MTCVRITLPGRQHGIICSDVNIFETPNPGCVNVAHHEPWPRGYLQCSDYADKMMKTHDQSQCPHCGLWAIWTPKEEIR
jgi:hypothetical protein